MNASLQLTTAFLAMPASSAPASMTHGHVDDVDCDDDADNDADHDNRHHHHHQQPQVPIFIITRTPGSLRTCPHRPRKERTPLPPVCRSPRQDDRAATRRGDQGQITSVQ